MAQLLRYDGTIEEDLKPADPEAGFSLQEIYVLLGCDIVETIPLPDGDLMILDEEGKMKVGASKKYNHRATILLHLAGGMPDDWICGHALICHDKEFQ